MGTVSWRNTRDQRQKNTKVKVTPSPLLRVTPTTTGNGKLAESRRPTKEEQKNNPCAARVNEYGTNDYWQARIQRDCPEELDAIKSGEKGITPALANRSSSLQVFWIARHASRISLFVGSRSGPTSRLMRAAFSSSGISEERTRCTPSLVA